MTPENKTGLPLNCAQCEEYLADLFDGTLGIDLKAAVESHLSVCTACAELAQDAGASVAFTERAAAVEIPATLVPRILAEITTGPSRVLVQASLAEKIFGRWIRPILQPRFALSLAMAALSLAMIPHVWMPASVSPGKIWNTAENRIYRTFDRAVRNYENLALVANVESQLDELRANNGFTDEPSTDSGRQSR